MSAYENGLSGSRNGKISVQTRPGREGVVCSVFLDELPEESGRDWRPLPDPVVDIGGVQGQKMAAGLFVRPGQKDEPGSREQGGHREIGPGNPEAGVQPARKVLVGDVTGVGFMVPEKCRPLSEWPEAHVCPYPSGKMHRMVDDLFLVASLTKED